MKHSTTNVLKTIYFKTNVYIITALRVNIRIHLRMYSTQSNKNHRKKYKKIRVTCTEKLSFDVQRCFDVVLMCPMRVCSVLLGLVFLHLLPPTPLSVSSEVQPFMLISMSFAVRGFCLTAPAIKMNLNNASSNTTWKLELEDNGGKKSFNINYFL
ncbi:MAG: hypothetical protein ACRCVL_06750 [Cetobacterium sp.]